MKSTAYVALLAAAISLTACASARPFVCDSVTIELEIGEASIAYPNKAANPVPSFQRNCPFSIKTTWLSGTTSDQWIELSDFVAVNYRAKAQKWQDPEPRKINGTDNAVKLDPTKTLWGPYTLPSAKPVGPPRLILFSLTLRTKSGEEVSLDPPWSEKKR